MLFNRKNLNIGLKQAHRFFMPVCIHSKIFEIYLGFFSILAKSCKGAIAKAEELSKEIPDSVVLSQFTNPDNPAIHKATTGIEIYNDTDGDLTPVSCLECNAEV